MDTFQFTIDSKKISRNKPNQRKDFYSENVKLLKKEQEELDNGKTCSQIGRINIVKMTI